MQTKQFYAAHLARDPRFDGKFFVAVKTTNIYCRPICPARKAKLENLNFYLYAEEAEENGFRPCLRCRPETAPGSAAWMGTSATIQRALRIMDTLATENLSINDIAKTLGIGERWLRNLFQQQIGASPKTVLHNKKLNTARRLLDETTLPVTEIAFSSGFQSIRRFNDAFKNRFGKAPNQFRGTKCSNNYNRIELSFRPPFDWGSLIHFFERRAIAGIEFVEGSTYGRSVILSGTKGWIVAKPGENNKVVVEFDFEKTTNLVEFVCRVKNIFDLDADPHAIRATLSKDKKLKPLLKKTSDLRIPGCWDGFEVAVRAIIGQQISVKGAKTILARLVERCGAKYCGPHSKICYCFPTPKAIEKGNLSGLGLTNSRISTLKSLASELYKGSITLDGTADYNQTREKLLAIKGIGPWTVDYISMRALKNPNSFPASDLELKRQVSNYELDPQQWEPWRSYGAIALWQIRAKTFNQSEEK